MDKELDNYYQHRFLMFLSEGWQDLIKDVQQMQESTNQLKGVEVENLRFKQGELSMMDWLLGLEEISKKAYEELQEDANI